VTSNTIDSVSSVLMNLEACLNEMILHVKP
jgi:hypothetical protein